MSKIKVYAVKIIGEYSQNTPYLGSLLGVLKSDFDSQSLTIRQQAEEIRLLREQRNAEIPCGHIGLKQIADLDAEIETKKAEVK